MTRRSVAVTGIGLVTPIGIGRSAVWQRLGEQRSAVTAVTRFDPSPFRSRVAAQIDDFDPAERLDARQARRTDRCSQFALVAAQEALDDAGLEEPIERPARVGVMMGTALGGIGFAEEQNGKYLAGGLREVDPLLALTVFGGAVSCNIAIAHGFTGSNATNAMSCASGTMAIGEGMRAIANGQSDVMLAGGSEAPLYPLCFGSFAMIRAMSVRNDDPAAASRPFDRGRDGFVMAEGAAVLVLEEMERARARGANIYCELAGYGASNDAHHMTAPRPDAREAARAMRLALQSADVQPERIDYVNAHATATEVDALKIDQSFVAAMTSDPQTAELVRIIVEMARTLGLEVVAEGVETEAQMERLVVVNADATPYDHMADRVVREPISTSLPTLVEELVGDTA